MRCANRFILSLLLLSSCLFTNAASASIFNGNSAQVDPPSRVARLSYVKGDVSFSPAAAKNNVWVVARVNRPFVTGDRIWVDTNARAELQLGNAAVRINDETSLRVINLNDQIAQFDLSQGSLILHVRQIKAGQTYEIDTPQLAFRVTQAGSYRVEVSDKGDSTVIIVRKGEGFAYAKNAAFKIPSSHAYKFVGTNLRAQALVLYSLDSFDKWSLDRENRVAKSPSLKYVSTTIIGYEDLDTYGNWSNTIEYGYVWAPRRVPSGWAPYRYGHWSWIYPWGWTWIDDQPWGFAPSHYGRWAHYRHRWVWIPGPRAAQSTYAPALVVFIGGGRLSFQVNSNPAIGWFPLGPRDVYVPPYRVSRTYFNNINNSNTTINQTQITNAYDNQTVPTNYSNYRVNSAITAVPTTSFVKSEPTANTAVPVTTTVVDQAPVSSIPTVTPDHQSSTGSQVTTSKPSDATIDRVPVVVTPPPSSEVPVITVTPPAETTIPPVVVTPPVVTPSTDKPNGGNISKNIEIVPKQDPATEKAAAEKIEADKKAAEAKAKADQQAAEKAAADNAAAEAKAKADNESAEKAAAEKLANEAKADADKRAAEKARAEKDAAEAQAKAEKAAAEKAEADKRAAAEKEAADKAKAAQEAATIRVNIERETAEKARAERAAAEARAEAERQAAEKAQAERAAEAAKAAAERQAAEQEKAAEAARAAKADAERQAAEQAEAEKAAAAARAQAEQAAEAQRQADEAAAAAKAEADKAAAEQAAPAPNAAPHIQLVPTQ